MSDFDPNSSQMARKIFGAVSAPGLAMPVADFAAFLPPNPLQFYQPVHRSYMSDYDGATATTEIFVDKANGLYNGRIDTVINGQTLVTELRAHIVGDSGFYRIDKLTIDNQDINLMDVDAASTALNVFMAYKNASFPTGGGPRAFFPRPGSQITDKPAPDLGNKGQRPGLRGH